MNTTENNTKICLCKAVLQTTIEDAIRKGARTVIAVSMEVGAGRGACKGGRCNTQIQALIDSYQKGEWQ